MFDIFYMGPKPNLFAFERPVKDLAEAQSLCRTNYFWVVNGLNDYKNFNFNFIPVPWEQDHTHVWPSQWQQNGGTMLVPRDSVEHKWHWHEEVVARKKSVPVYYMDFHNDEGDKQFQKLKKQNLPIKSVRYIGSHLEVFKRIIKQATSEYIWIISSICNYEEFDFNWHPGQWQAEMIHCFSWTSNDPLSRRGDTFYIHVDSFKKQMYELELLDWFNVIHYNDEQTVYYFPCPVVEYTEDNLADAIKNYDFKFPYANFLRPEDKDFSWWKAICLWSEKDRQVVPFTTNHGSCLVPKDIKQYLKTQIYDYPYLKTSDIVVKTSDRLEIKFISNGEPEADHWFNHCLEHSRGSNIERIMNVNGRAAAYRAAAERSKTDWFFAVFAKLEVDAAFDWTWQPDYWQEPKHYIFHARNPVNGLVYGHQAMIAYNKRLVLETIDSGLDFTLSKAHEVIPILSGTAHYNQDPWTTWRTAFREVLKLRHFQSIDATVETEYRLNTWLTVAHGQYAEWSLKGARDAAEYFESVDGNYNQLMLSFEWSWLRQYADFKEYTF